MLFNSFPFIFLFLITFGLYYLPVFSRFQVHLLVAASFVFYAWYQPEWLLLLLFSITINAYTSYQVYYGLVEKRKFNATLGVVINIATLVFFKYSPVFSKTFLSPDNSIGSFLLHVPLPIGISFFTFHGISMLLDLYLGKNIEANKEFIPKLFTRHWLYTSLYISFFPQLVCGPITKSYNFMPQIVRKSINNINWEPAFKHIIMGYFLKMVIADNIKDQTFWAAFPFFEYQTSWTLFALIFGYAIQIFADFAGYSFIALGIAMLFGYNLPLNFNYPYISASISEFWQRWHISLSVWLYEYLFDPIVVFARDWGKWAIVFGLMVTFAVSGMWHGAGLNFLTWGIIHGIGLSLYFLTTRLRRKLSKVIPKLIYNSFAILLTFIFVCFSYIFFRAATFTQAILYLHDMATHWHRGVPSPAIILNIFMYSAPVVLFHFYYLYKENGGRRLPKSVQPLVYGLMLFAIFVNSGSAGEFIYFQF